MVSERSVESFSIRLRQSISSSTTAIGGPGMTEEAVKHEHCWITHPGDPVGYWRCASCNAEGWVKDLVHKAFETECRHVNFEVRPGNRIGCGTCLDCGKEIWLSALFTGLIERTKKASSRTDDEIKKHIQDLVPYEVNRLLMSTWGKAEIAKAAGEITRAMLQAAADKIKEAK
jgi:hypothetical protein